MLVCYGGDGGVLCCWKVFWWSGTGVSVVVSILPTFGCVSSVGGGYSL